MNKEMMVFGGFLLLVFGCTETSGLPENKDEAKPTELPAGADVISCEGQPEAPSFCDWIGSADTVVWGRLLEVKMAAFPAVLATDNSQIVNECDGPVNGALELVLSVEEVYHGSPGETVTIRVGHHQLDEWEPRPFFAPRSEEIEWSTPSPGLKVGDHIGAALYQSPAGDMWGLLGGILFADGEDGRLITTERTYCQEPAPVGLAGLTRAELGEAVLACPTELSTEAIARATKMDSVWESAPYAYAGMCFGSTEPSTNATDTDSD